MPVVARRCVHSSVQNPVRFWFCYPCPSLRKSLTQVETNSAPPTATLRASGTGHGEALVPRLLLCLCAGTASGDPVSLVPSICSLIPLCPLPAPGAPEVKTQGCGKLAESRSTSTRPLPAGRRSTSGASLLDSNGCMLALARSSSLVSPGIWLGPPAAARLPAKLPDPSAGALTGLPRWPLLQRRHPCVKRDSSSPPPILRALRCGGRVPARDSRWRLPPPPTQAQARSLIAAC